MDNAARITKMTALLTDALSPTLLEITDDSHLHAGHAGAATGKGHFTVTISSPCFHNKRAIQQHQMVYQALKDMMETDIHAISIKSC